MLFSSLFVTSLTSACDPGLKVFLHFVHLKHGRCQSLPSEVTFSARRNDLRNNWSPLTKVNLFTTTGTLRHDYRWLMNGRAQLEHEYVFERGTDSHAHRRSSKRDDWLFVLSNRLVHRHTDSFIIYVSSAAHLILESDRSG